jgi:hypothetical protein
MDVNVQRLQLVFGQRVIAYCAGVRSPKLVDKWARHEAVPTLEQAHRLADLEAWVEALRGPDGNGEANETIRALAFGMWPDLDDRAPVEVIRDGEGWRAVSAAQGWSYR